MHTSDVRSVTAARRELAERILHLAGHLQPQDRQLIEATFDRGLSTAELSILMGRSTSAVRRHLRRLVTRLASPEAAWIMQQLEHWPRLRGRIAVARHITGLSQRRVAEALELKLHRVRHEDQLIREQLREALARPARTRPQRTYQAGMQSRRRRSSSPVECSAHERSE